MSSAPTATAKLGVVADTAVELAHLQSLVGDNGYRVVLALRAEQVGADQLQDCEVDAWVAALGDCDESLDCLDILLEGSPVPVLLGDAVPPLSDAESFRAWQRRTVEKLAGLSLSVESEPSENPLINEALNRSLVGPKAVWVLAASLGGPAAVREFLQQLPDDLPVAFVYAQHIDAEFDGHLARTLDPKHGFNIRKMHDRDQLQHGDVCVVPATQSVSFLPQGRIVVNNSGWNSRFSPCIDQVMCDVARIFKQQCGTIVFSGMSNDCEMGVRFLHSQGGEVWAQSPATCANSSMPDAALATGCVSFQGSPATLAKALLDRYRGAE